MWSDNMVTFTSDSEEVDKIVKFVVIEIKKKVRRIWWLTSYFVAATKPWVHAPCTHLKRNYMNMTLWFFLVHECDWLLHKTVEFCTYFICYMNYWDGLVELSIELYNLYHCWAGNEVTHCLMRRHAYFVCQFLYRLHETSLIQSWVCYFYGCSKYARPLSYDQCQKVLRLITTLGD